MFSKTTWRHYQYTIGQTTKAVKFSRNGIEKFQNFKFKNIVSKIKPEKPRDQKYFKEKNSLKNYTKWCHYKNLF